MALLSVWSALRVLWRRPAYALVNLAGLSVGLACCLLAVAFLQYERQWDHHHQHADRLYRIVSERGNEPWSSIRLSRAAHGDPSRQNALPDQLTASIPAVEQAAQFTILRGEDALGYIETPEGDRYVSPPRLVTTTGGAVAQLFSFDRVAGEPLDRALEDPGSAVLTRPIADTYFGAANPIGQSLTVHHDEGETTLLTVRAVIKEPPPDSRIQFGAAMNVSAMASSSAFQYVLLGKGADPEALKRPIESVMTAVNPALNEPDSDWSGAHLQALTDAYLGAPTLHNTGPNRDVRLLWVFGGIAALVLGITVINYANLGMALHAGRTRELGARKAIGAQPSQIAATVLSETLILAVASAPAALALAAAGVPLLNDVMEAEIVISWLFTPARIGILVGLAVLAGLLAGSYPAFVLSRRRVADLLTGERAPSGRGRNRATVRHSLITLQFGVLIVLGTVSLVAYQQLQDMQIDSLGYDPSGVVEVTSIQGDRQAYARFRRLALQSSTVEAVGMGSAVPDDATAGMAFALVDGDGNRRTFQGGASHAVDVHWFEVMGIDHPVVDSMIAADGRAPMRWMINETAARLLDGEAGGAASGIRWSFKPEDASNEGFAVAGVVRDLHLVPKRQPIPPTVYRVFPSAPFAGVPVVRLAEGQTRAGLEHLRQVSEQVRPDTPFAATFLTDQHAQFYAEERRFAWLAGSMGGLALILAVVGLANLVGQLTQQRRREIGIRKALGGSTAGIVALLNREYLYMMIAAFVVGAPAAWVVVHRWMQSYAVPAEIPAWPFVLTGMVALVVALGTVTVHAIRAATVDPAAVLRAE